VNGGMAEYRHAQSNRKWIRGQHAVNWTGGNEVGSNSPRQTNPESSTAGNADLDFWLHLAACQAIVNQCVNRLTQA
jgi:hypothetical protein